MGKLVKLKELGLGTNQLRELPNLGDLSELTMLPIYANQLEYIGPWIGSLRSLEKLDLSCNNLSDIPDRIVGCVSLTYLNVKRNRLHTLPQGISALSKLEFFDCTENELRNVPMEILSAPLKHFRATRNPFAMPTLDSDGMSKLPKTLAPPRLMDLACNKVLSSFALLVEARETLPPELIRLLHSFNVCEVCRAPHVGTTIEFVQCLTVHHNRDIPFSRRVCGPRCWVAVRAKFAAARAQILREAARERVITAAHQQPHPPQPAGMNQQPQQQRMQAPGDPHSINPLLESVATSSQLGLAAGFAETSNQSRHLGNAENHAVNRTRVSSGAALRVDTRTEVDGSIGSASSAAVITTAFGLDPSLGASLDGVLDGQTASTTGVIQAPTGSMVVPATPEAMARLRLISSSASSSPDLFGVTQPSLFHGELTLSTALADPNAEISAGAMAIPNVAAGEFGQQDRSTEMEVDEMRNISLERFVQAYRARNLAAGVDIARYRAGAVPTNGRVNGPSNMHPVATAATAAIAVDLQRAGPAYVGSSISNTTPLREENMESSPWSARQGNTAETSTNRIARSTSSSSGSSSSSSTTSRRSPLARLAAAAERVGMRTMGRPQRGGPAAAGDA
jgi:hypothetical protein